MINSYLSRQITQNFPYDPTEDQVLALNLLSNFLLSEESDSLLLLKGYAGTGKTSLVGALVKTMTELKQKSILLAPTGRAAKVFSGYAGQKAFTIHKKIYRQKAFSNEPTGFHPADNLHKDTLFIVDEASMIANEGLDSFVFGTGRLLDDLVQYVYSGENCRLILMGDVAQLPPVMQTESPALNPETLRGYNLKVQEITLTQVVRQSENSGRLTKRDSRDFPQTKAERLHRFQKGKRRRTHRRNLLSLQSGRDRRDHDYFTLQQAGYPI